MSSNPDKMHRSWQRALELFEASGGSLNRKAVRLSAGYHALRRAEVKARARQGSGAARDLLQALTLDPARTSAKLAYRAARAARKALSGPAGETPLIPYFEMSTREAAPPPAGEIKSIAGTLARWDKRRMARFGRR
jgi:hypothetical protein